MSELNRKCAAKHPHGGFYLVEVMLTLVVLSIGLLGLGVLHIHSKQTNLVAAQRSFASHLSHDLLERMRSNGAGLASYVPTDSARVLDGNSVSEPGTKCTVDAQCDTLQLAVFDLWDWELLLAGVTTQLDDDNAGILLSPTACLSRPAGGGSGMYTVAIVWRSTKPIENPLVTTNPTANSCGAASGRYDFDASGDNRMRHVIWIESYLAA